MKYKNNLKKLMEENNLSQYRLDKICGLCINTIRKIVNNPYHNTNLKSLSILAEVLDCSIKDLIEDDPEKIYYERTAEKYKENPLFHHNQVFSPENLNYLRNLLLQVGVSCKVSSYGRYKTASVKNEYELSSIQLDFNLRLLNINNRSILQVANFYVSVNQVLLNEAIIKDAFIKALEKYVLKLHINEIEFFIDQDFERKTDNYSNSQSELPADFCYTLGSDSNLFIQNNFERSPFSKFEDFQIIWKKTLSSSLTE
ncbi:hypothetical protein AM500_18620 [Bacillus sp. FJAT-18017]|uniref:helix-turn-helix domain-containing protein n=1 Tax=Bacillus sp. FJAT-18017 TaxID=1705566 RepID=UPI0006B04545|nr:helix-turn-helix transcriptional regulator [Bacillus sp. FJAT-18017]ALC91574.1 hypothetical protein AM500_18620 [Bacillus sp. FJAT-18017]